MVEGDSINMTAQSDVATVVTNKVSQGERSTLSISNVMENKTEPANFTGSDSEPTKKAKTFKYITTLLASKRKDNNHNQ